MKCYRVRFEVEEKVRAVDEFDAVDAFFRKLVEGIANADYGYLDLDIEEVEDDECD